MSQAILKLANGDKVNNPQKPEVQENLVEWGPRQYKYSDLENAVMDNSIDSYLSKQGISGNAASEIKGYMSQYLKGFKEGKIKRKADGTYDVYDAALITDTNPVKRGIFGRIRGDKKRLALGYFNELFTKMTPHTEPSKEETPKQKFSFGYGKQLRRNIFKDDNESPEEQEIWYSNENKWDTAKQALDRYRESLNEDYDFSNTSFRDKAEYVSALDNLDQAIASKDANLLKQSLYNIGEADLYSLFMNKNEWKNANLTPEQKEKLAQQKQEEISKKAQEVSNVSSETSGFQQQLDRDIAQINKELAYDVGNWNLNFPELNVPPTVPRIVNVGSRTYNTLFPKDSGSFWGNLRRSVPGAVGRIVPGVREGMNLKDVATGVPAVGKALWNFITYLAEPVPKEEKGGKIVKGALGTPINLTPTPIRNTSQRQAYNRENDLLNNQNVLNYLASLNTDNYNEFNGYEDLYDSNYTNTYGAGSLSNWGTHSLDTLKLDPRTRNMQYVWNSRKGLNDPIFSGFQGVGVSGDNVKEGGEDGRFGNMTIQRTLGRGINEATAQKYNELLKKNGLEFYKAEHGGYRVRPIVSSGNTPDGTTKQSGVSSLNGSTLNTLKNPAPSPLQSGAAGDPALEYKEPFRPKISAENVGDLRFLITQLFNNKQKYSPNILTTDAPEISAKVQYNLPMESYYGKAAARFRRLGAQAATADQTQNFARQLEAESKAEELEGKGRLANLETYAKTTEAAQQAENANIAARVANANQNRARMVAGLEAKDAFERAKTLKRGQNLANWLYGKQQSLAQKEGVQKSLELQNLQETLASDYNTAAKAAWEKLNAAKAAYKPVNNIPWESSPEYKRAYEEYMETLNNARREGTNQLRQKQSSMYGTGFFKKGGGLTYAEKKNLQDAKEYNKMLLADRREFNKLLRLSITEGNKTIRGISNYSAQLIKNSLKL